MSHERSRRTGVWFVSELYAPELTSTGYYLTQIAERAAERLDADVHAIASQPTYSARGVKAARREHRGDVQVLRTSGPSLPKDSLVGKIGNMAAFCIGAFAVLLRDLRRGDVVVAVTNPPLAPYLAAMVARIRGAKFVLLVHDMFPETLPLTGLARPGGIVVRALDTASRRLLREATLVIAIGRDMQERLEAKGSTSVVMIPNWADTDEIQATPARGTQGTPFVVQYAGNIGRTHDVDLLLRAAEATRGQVQWDFIGSGGRRSALERTVASLGLTNVRVADYRPRAERSRSLGDCHAAIISFVAGMSGISVPSRMYNIMAAGRPIIAVCDHDSELARVVREHGIGWVVPPGDSDQLVAVLRSAGASPDCCVAMGERARAVAVAHYSRDAVLDRYASALDRVLRS